TKNREPHTLPLSDYLHEMLMRRQARAVSQFVFPGTGTGGYLIEPRRHVQLVARSVPFIIHDLRRTFLTVAEGLDVPAYALKRLANHKMNDVTAGYIIAGAERLRKPMQQITDYLLSAMEIKPKAQIVDLLGAETR
ncbi:MAG: hypothetical protein MN733_08150, partial [Nitrososphaera sp.]|nr:hypothetical protein [Nitrososphaera sp.]